jgi:hypothetical protein
MREALLPMAVISLPEQKATKPLSETQIWKQRAAEAWNALPVETKVEWTKFAAKFRRYSVAKHRVAGPSPRSLYIKAALERWRLDSSLLTPVQPPHSAFSGDEIGVFAVPSGKNNPVPTGHLRIAATGRNRTGVMTALMVQKLTGPNRKPSERGFKTANFVTFTHSQTTFDLALEPGYYATAYRFVEASTLQMSPIQEAGIIAIGIKPRRKKAKSVKPTPATPPTHAVIDLERFATLHHWPS